MVGFTIAEGYRVAGPKCAFFEHPHIESGTATVDEQLDDVVATKLCSQFETRLPRLRDLKQRRTDSNLISDGDRLLGEAFDCQVFPKCSPGRQIHSQRSSPKLIM